MKHTMQHFSHFGVKTKINPKQLDRFMHTIVQYRLIVFAPLVQLVVVVVCFYLHPKETTDNN